MSIKVKKTDIRCVETEDLEPDLAYLKETYEDDGLSTEDIATYQAHNKERLHAYGSAWTLVVIRADVEVLIPLTPETGIYQTFRSGGLFGIESDSSKEYKAAVFEEQREELCAILAALGIVVEKDQ